MHSVAQTLAVLQISDIHLLKEAYHKMLGINTEHYFLEVLRQAFSEGTHYDVLLLTGDLVQDACEKSYQRLSQHLQFLPIPVICLPGNHDNVALMEQSLNSGNVSCQKQYLIHNWQIISLNSQIPKGPGGYLEEDELIMLEDYLSNNPQYLTIVAVHHHCTLTYSEWMDTMIIGNRERFLNLLARYPQVKLVIHGHIHQELEERIDNLLILGAPSTCFQFTPKSYNFSLDQTAPGYREIRFYADGHVESTVKRLPNDLYELNLNEPGYAD